MRTHPTQRARNSVGKCPARLSQVTQVLWHLRPPLIYAFFYNKKKKGTYLLPTKQISLVSPQENDIASSPVRGATPETPLASCDGSTRSVGPMVRPSFRERGVQSLRERRKKCLQQDKGMLHDTTSEDGPGMSGGDHQGHPRCSEYRKGVRVFQPSFKIWI
jgi:hypothetical protein